MWRFEDIERDNVGNIEPAKLNQRPAQKKVFQYEVDGTLIKTYVSTVEAAKAIGIDNSRICAVCNGRKKTAKGYVFRYEGSDFKGYSDFKPNGFRKKVKKMNLDGEVLEVYSSLSEAARENKTAPSNIGNCCRGKNKTAIGFKWCFVEEDFKDMMDDYQRAVFNAKPVVQLELDGSFIAEYESAAEAARFLGLERGSISKVCVGSADSHFGYVWKFLDDYNNGSENKALRERNVGKKSVLKLSMDGDILESFKSIKEAADSISVMEPVLNSALSGRIFSTGGFRWTYDGEANEIKNVQEREKVIIKTDIKKVKKYSLSGDFIEEYESIKEAAKTISLTEEAIRKVCKGEAISAGGYAWRYWGEEDYVFREKRYRHKKVKQFTLDGSFLKEFKSVKEAASFMKCSSSLISGACNGKLKHAKGFKWEYTEGSSK
ncbi:NUMOD1 domain-containing DNA-binding protein [Bacillus wiedmannii]|nr:NUMOD1 domain-containing DNA-binding protein [Bacillus wiedmannii]